MPIIPELRRQKHKIPELAGQPVWANPLVVKKHTRCGPLEVTGMLVLLHTAVGIYAHTQKKLKIKV